MRGITERHQRVGAVRRRAVFLTAGAVVAAALSAAVPATSTATPAARPAAAAAAAAEPAGTPVAAAAADGAVTILARGADGTLYRRVQDRENGGWSAWAGTGGTVAGDPVTARDLDKRLSVFVRRAGGHLWQQKQAADGTWAAWRDLGTPPGTTAAGAPVVVANDNTFSTKSPDSKGFVKGNTDGRLELFVRGADGHLWHRVQKAANGTAWSGWEALRGTWAGNPAAVVGGDGRITLFGRKSDGTLKVTGQKRRSSFEDPLPEDNWSDWKEIDTGYTANVTVVGNIREDGTLFQVFGNRSDGRLWTLTQSKPGTDRKPAGVWATAAHRTLGPAVPGRPVVATHTDGRLAVYSIDAENRVAYRTQSGSADETNVNGLWPAGWRPLNSLKARSVTTVSSTREGSPAFDVFAVAKDSDTVYQRRRLATGSLDGSREDIWLDWADLAPVGAGACAGPGSLDCLTIENSDLGLAMGLESFRDPKSYISRGARSALQLTKWALRPTDDPLGAVAIVNTTHHTCVDEDGSSIGPFELRLAPCDRTSKQQQWYIEPVMPANADKATTTPTDFRIRHRAEPDRCLTALAADSGLYTAKRLKRISCNTESDNDHNTWKLGNGGVTAPGVLGIVLKQAAEWCTQNPALEGCTFVPLEEPAAYQAAQGCVAGRVLFNDSTERDAEYYIDWTATTGTEFTFGGNVGFEGEGLSVGFNASMTWLRQESVSEEAQVHVPPKQFGWVEIAPVMRETAGYWKIAMGGTWTVPGRNVSYAKEKTNGVTTLIVPKTSKMPPVSGHCG